MLRNDYLNEKMLERKFKSLKKQLKFLMKVEPDGYEASYSEYNDMDEKELYENEKEVYNSLFENFNHEVYSRYKYIVTASFEHPVSAILIIEESRQITEDTEVLLRMLLLAIQNEDKIKGLPITEPYNYMKCKLMEDLIEALQKECNQDVIDVVAGEVLEALKLYS